MNGLPLLKPPYGHLTAIDLNHGTIAWQVPFGDANYESMQFLIDRGT